METPTFYLRPKTGSRLRLRLFHSKVPAGFTSPAVDYVERTSDLNEELITQK